MPYRFRREETLGAGTRRIAREIIDKTLSCLGDDSLPAEFKTHEARKAVKRLRGLIRLVGPQVQSQSQFKSLDTALKKTGKQLAEARDRDVLRATLAEIAGEPEDSSGVAADGPLKVATEVERQRAFGQVMEELSNIQSDLGSLRLEGNGPEHIKPGYIETYRSSRKRMNKALRTMSDAQLHRWREMVKYHSYHTNLVAGLDGGRLKDRRANSQALEEVLGKHHDLAMLESHLKAQAKKKKLKKLNGVRLDELRRRIRCTRRQTERETERLGKTLFAEKPGKAEKNLPL